jgi:hypothetical protein
MNTLIRPGLGLVIGGKNGRSYMWLCQYGHGEVVVAVPAAAVDAAGVAPYSSWPVDSAIGLSETQAIEIRPNDTPGTIC